MPNPPGLTVLSLDGVPHALAERLIDSGDMPTLAALADRHGRPRMMRSVFPTVSCVAWACYATGRNPGKHGIYGFIDREPGSYDLDLPNAADMHGPNIWEVLSERGKRVFGMNVPSTYPPRKVNGVLIGGFLAPSLEKVASPASEADYLRGIDYRIDADAALARGSKSAMLGDLAVTLDKRVEAMLHYLDAGPWDFFHTHIMGTDRINHFLFSAAGEGAHGELGEGFVDYYRKVDDAIARLLDAIGDGPLMILSDHGFCPITYEVQLSRYLIERGWTTPADRPTSPLSIVPEKSRVFSMIPGRVYVNLEGRDAGGCVPPGEYDHVREQVAAELLAMRDPEGRAVIRRVLRREELYWPDARTGPTNAHPSPDDPPPYRWAPDLVAVPHDGYDLKMGMIAPETFVRTELEGMHTYHDAMLLTRGVEVPDGDMEIRALAGPIFRTLGLEPPKDMDATVLPPPVGAI